MEGAGRGGSWVCSLFAGRGWLAWYAVVLGSSSGVAAGSWLNGVKEEEALPDLRDESALCSAVRPACVRRDSRDCLRNWRRWPASPDKKYELKSLPDEKFSGLHMMCLMYAGFKRIPEHDFHIDLAEPFLKSAGNVPARRDRRA
jgi:hypothetical protein